MKDMVNISKSLNKIVLKNLINIKRKECIMNQGNFGRLVEILKNTELSFEGRILQARFENEGFDRFVGKYLGVTASPGSSSIGRDYVVGFGENNNVVYFSPISVNNPEEATDLFIESMGVTKHHYNPRQKEKIYEF